MDPAEQIVNLWLQKHGFFVRSGIKLRGGKEIDFLAINPETDRRVHVEVHVSVFPLGRFRAWGSIVFVGYENRLYCLAVSAYNWKLYGAMRAVLQALRDKLKWEPRAVRLNSHP